MIPIRRGTAKRLGLRQPAVITHWIEPDLSGLRAACAAFKEHLQNTRPIVIRFPSVGP